MMEGIWDLFQNALTSVNTVVFPFCWPEVLVGFCTYLINGTIWASSTRWALASHYSSATSKNTAARTRLGTKLQTITPHFVKGDNITH